MPELCSYCKQYCSENMVLHMLVSYSALLWCNEIYITTKSQRTGSKPCKNKIPLLCSANRRFRPGTKQKYIYSHNIVDDSLFFVAMAPRKPRTFTYFPTSHYPSDNDEDQGVNLDNLVGKRHTRLNHGGAHAGRRNVYISFYF